MFMERNHLWDKVKVEKDFDVLQKLFLAGSLSYTLEKELRIFIKLITKPLAVRSSSLFEDSMSQPFSGIFGTYLLPIIMKILKSDSNSFLKQLNLFFRLSIHVTQDVLRSNKLQS